MKEIFLAFASGNDFHKTILEESAAAATTLDRKIRPWSLEDPSGHPISNTVEHWIDKADGFVGDITHVNMNVTYEIGYALGLGLPLRLVRSVNSDFTKVQKIGLLDTLAHDSYDFQPKLREILSRDDQTSQWTASRKSKEQPIFVLQPSVVGDVSRKTLSAIKKIVRMKFRNFNPAEISRFTAPEAFEAATSSFGLFMFWIDGDSEDAIRNNQRSCFLYGLGRGLGIPSVLLAHESSKLPLDVHDSATRWSHLDNIDELIEDFRNSVAEELVQYSDEESPPSKSKLGKVAFGDPVAENEQAKLSQYFVQTESFRKAKTGNAHVLTGRKGSGKTAIFLRVRDVSRANKQNIVVDLMPDGYQLIKLKEFILDKLSFGTRKEVIAAFWEYILWLEIAYKILEKDAYKSRNDPETFERYEALRNFFNERVDTGEGDFSERLSLLADNVISRFSAKESEITDTGSLKSSEVLEIIYGHDLRNLRENVLSYLEIKGFVLFLFDNLDRIWTPGGFDQDDAQILVGLAEAMQKIERNFMRKDLDFRWILFIRSDVYEFLIAGMADYGKLSTSSLEWSDRDQLKILFNQRLLSGFVSSNSDIQFSDISVPLVNGSKALDFLIDGSLMRPRYLIRLFETARRRALTLENTVIREDDYNFALKELGWQVLEDLDREIADLINDASSFLFDVVENRASLTPEKLRYLASAKLKEDSEIEKLIDLMIWNGSLGVVTQSGKKFIFDVGYKRKYLANLIENNPAIQLCLHPTLVGIAS